MKTQIQLIPTKKLYSCLLSIALCLTLTSVYAQRPGTLDRSFGDTGVVVTSQENHLLEAQSSMLQQDGKIIVAGYGGVSVLDSSLTGFLFIRYLADGSLDSTFGVNGMSVVNPDGYHGNYIRSIIELQDGKILACGYAIIGGIYEYNYNALLMRLNSDGSIDSSFANNGFFIYDSGPSIDEFSKVLLAADGKIIICGDIALNSVLLARLNPDGSPDESFGTNGIIVDGSLFAAKVWDASLQEDGKIVIGGTAPGTFTQFMVGRYNPDGTPDESFGTNGKTVTNISGAFSAITIQPDGKIIGAGESATNGYNSKETLIRYNTDGSEDLSFGKNGVVSTAYPTGFSAARDVVLQPDGKIVTVVDNFSGTYAFEYFGVNRYNIDGSLDSSFGENGITTTEIGEANVPSGILLQPDGKIVVSGNIYVTEQPYSAVGLARYYCYQEEKNKYVKIKHWLHKHGFTWEDWPGKNNITSYTIERSSNGNSFTAIGRLFRNGSGQYHFEDAAPLAGNNYYRVAAVSSSGNISYSNILSIPNNDAVTVYPNPAKNNISITGLSASEKTSLRITDLNGNLKVSTTITASSYNWNISSLPKGNYVLQVVSGGNVITKKIMKE